MDRVYLGLEVERCQVDVGLGLGVSRYSEEERVAIADHAFWFG